MDIYQWAESFGASVVVIKADRQLFDREDAPMWRAYVLHKRHLVRIYRHTNGHLAQAYEMSYFGFGYSPVEALYHLCDNIQGLTLEIHGHTEAVPATLELDGESTQ